MKLQQPELANVQCEVCHGYATEHLNDGKPIPTLKPAMALCVKRHTPYRAPDFQKNAKMVYTVHFYHLLRDILVVDADNVLG